MRDSVKAMYQSFRHLRGHLAAGHVQLILAIRLFAIFFPVFVTAAPLPHPNVTTDELRSSIASHLSKVEEFKFIRAEAEKMGVKVWLFGGTAAGFAHYVKWDLQRLKGDPRFQADRFDYDYTNIFRSTQDLDIVVDGTLDQANELESSLKSKFPYMQGRKSVWEVRLLGTERNGKLPLLDNPDFLNQHTDSNSTGMIELTAAATEIKTIVRDLRDWRSEDPYFLRDVAEGKIHYYDSPTHVSTKLAKAGDNPPIFSVIRYLTKAFQYELELRPEDMAIIQKRVEEFNPQNDLKTDKSQYWIEKNSSKLFQHAVNLEYAAEVLDQLGLRKKLIAIKGDVTHAESMAWWLSREPLKTHELGQGHGRTAAELGMDIVAHETRSFQSYESMTRAHTGDPNVFISRDGAVGEVAAFGNGFYTAVGKKGARGTGITIRFHVKPEAREGSDFDISHDYVIVKNKAALTVIPESLQLGPSEYLELIWRDPEIVAEKAMLEKLHRRILKYRVQEMNAAETAKMDALMHKSSPLRQALDQFLAGSVQDSNEACSLSLVLAELLKLSFFERYFSLKDLAKQLPNLRYIDESSQSALLEALGKSRLRTDRRVLEYAMSLDDSHNSQLSFEVGRLFGAQQERDVDLKLLNSHLFKKYGMYSSFMEGLSPTLSAESAYGRRLGTLADWYTYIIARTSNDYRLKNTWFYQGLIKNVDPSLRKSALEIYFSHDRISNDDFADLLEQADHDRDITVIEKLVSHMKRRGDAKQSAHLIKFLSTQRSRYPSELVSKWIECAMQKMSANEAVDLAKIFIQDGRGLRETIVRHYVAQPTAVHGWAMSALLETLFESAEWRQPELMVAYLNIGINGVSMSDHIATNSFWLDQPDVMRQAMQNPGVNLTRFLAEPTWISQHPDVVQEWLQLHAQDRLDHYGIKRILSEPASASHPEWLEILVNNRSAEVREVKAILALPHWQTNKLVSSTLRKAGLIRLPGVPYVTGKNIQRAFAAGHSLTRSAPRQCRELFTTW